MPLPTERTVTGKFVNPVTEEPYDGTNGEHYVIFEPVPDRWTDQTGKQILLGGGRVNLDAQGSFSEDVVCTDVSGVLPAEGRLYRLRQFVGGAWAEPQFIAVPVGDGSPLDITNILSVEVQGTPYVPVEGPVGPAGPMGPQGPEGEPGLDGGLDTGITFGGDINPNATNPLAVDISPLIGRIVDYSSNPPAVTPVESAEVITVELDLIAQTRSSTWLLMDADLNVFQQEGRPSPEDRRNFLALGVVIHSGGSIELAQSIPTIVEQPINQFYDLLDAIGAFNMTGNQIAPSGTNLLLSHSPGQVFSRGWNYFDGGVRTGNPHIVSTVGASPASWVHVLRDSDIDISSATATVDAGHYDAAGTLTAVGGDAERSVVHQLWIFPTSDGSEIHVLQYGQQVFDTLDDAVAAAPSVPVVRHPALPGNAILLAHLAVKHSATDLSDPAQAQIITVSAFGGTGGGGGGGGGGDLSDYAQLAGAEFTGPIGSRLSSPESVALYSRATGDTQDRFRRDASGGQQWGSGSAPADTELRRLAAGVLAFLGTDLVVGQEDGKANRLRQSGANLNLDASGADLILSVFELGNFAGAERAYLRLEAGARLAHALGKWIFADTALGSAVHTLDGSANQLGFHGATAVGQQTVSGARSSGAALQSLLQALDLVGLINDTSTAGPVMVQSVNGEAGPDVTLGATDVGAIPAAEKGVANGVATLGSDGKVTGSQLPAAPVTSVNGETGAVSLNAADIGAVATTEKGAAGGVATLDGSGKVPSAQLPAAGVTSVNGETGAVALNAADVGALDEETANDLYTAKDALVFSVLDHGATGNGTTDDAAAINAILASSPAGSVIVLPAKTYAIGVPIVVPPGKTLLGMRSDLMGSDGLYDPNVMIKPLSSFTGVAAIRLLSQATGGYAAVSGEQRIQNLTLDGVNIASGVDGIQAKGNVQNVALRDVTVRRFPGSGIFCGIESGASPRSWRLERVLLDANETHGLYAENTPDLTLLNCQATGSVTNGFMLVNAPNTQLVACRSEWNGAHGFYLSGNWGDGTGSGGALLSGCSTDRNNLNGVYIDANGTAPFALSNLMTRRDGRNGGSGGGGYAGVAVNNAATPVVIGDWTNFPGVDDDGTQSTSPQYGASVTDSAHVQIDNSYLHAEGGGLHDGGGNGTLHIGPSVAYATGPTNSPVRTFAASEETTVWRRRDLPDPVTVDSLYAGTAPTISVSQTSTPTSGYIKYAPPGAAISGSDVTGPFTYLGAGGFQIGTGTPDSTYVLPTSRYPNTRGTLTSSQSVWSLEFGTDAQTFQLRFNYQTAGMYRLSIDGRKVTDLMAAVGGTTAGSTHLMTVNLGSAAPRVIRFDFYTVPFGGVYLPPGATMWSTVRKSDRFMVLGDSISDGSAVNTGGGGGTWAHRTARLLGSNDYWDEGRGGTGYITAGSFATFANRVAADVVAWSPDRLVVWGGYNDNGGNQATIQAAAESLFATIRAGLPETEVYVIGCFAPTGSPGASIVNTDNTLKAAAAASGYAFISPLTGEIYNAEGTLVATHGRFITGTGRVGATTGSGNADIYIGTDAVHPTDAGHVYLSRRIAAAIQELMPA